MFVRFEAIKLTLASNKESFNWIFFKTLTRLLLSKDQRV